MDYYEKNMEEIRKHHGHLVALMEATETDEDKVRVLYAESGEPRIAYRKDDGEEIFIHSSEDPQKYAKKALDMFGAMGREGVAVVFGFGLGYFAEELLKVLGKGHIMMIYEVSPELFRTALKVRDLSDFLSSEKVKIIIGENAEDFGVIHAYHNHIMFGRFWLVTHHSSIKVNEAAYERFFKRLKEEKLQADMNVGTVIGLGKEFINTFMANVPHIIRKPGVNKLKDIFKGRPAIVVSAGPSLNNNIHLLQKMKGRAVIIAVDAVLPTLLPSQIIPDVVTAIDPLPVNIFMFKDIPVLKEVPFICLAQFTPEIMNMYPGPIFVNGVSTNIVYQWLAQLWEDKGSIECFGGSVAHLAFSAAEFMGCDRIALIGQDLSFKGDVVYSKGFEDMKYETRDFLKVPKDVYHAVRMAGSVPAVDIFGDEVSTKGDFLSFKTSFENKIRSFKGSVINCTEGGLQIEGSKVMRLCDFIEEYCDLPEIDMFSILADIEHGPVSYNLDGLIAEAKAARNIFTGIRKKSASACKLIDKARKMTNDKKEESPQLYSLLQRLDSIQKKVSHPILNIIAAYHYKLELYLRRQEMQDVDDIEDRWEKIGAQLWRGINYYGELIEAIDLFLKELNKLIKSLELEAKVNALLMDQTLPVNEQKSKAGMIYKKEGMAAQAVKYLEAMVADQAGALNPAPVIAALAEMYIRQFRFYEAKEMLERLRGRRQAETVVELLKTCDEKIRDWEQRKERMTKLLKDAEENYGGDLESGYFYFRVKEYERAEKAYLKAIKEKGSRVQVEPSDPDLSAAYYGLAHVYLAQGETEKAVGELEKAIETDPRNPILYRDLGFIAFQNNNVDAAERFFTRAIELAPQQFEMYKLLGDFYIGQSEIKKAVALFEDALLANPDQPAFQQELASLYQIVISEKSGTA
ncbi:MAG: DUF115 domain-containing protein [Nitrospirae bacterium]|nr:DUF115 domain-containing protein [Nitrospirota bacterium]